MSPAQKRRAIKHVIEQGKGTTAEACRALDLQRSTYYRNSTESAERQRMEGRKFANFDEFRKEFWTLVGNHAELSKSFSKQNVTLMKQGNAPYVHPTQKLGERAVYELHHAKPIQHGGDVYDVDNLIVVTPRYHKEVLESVYHFQ